MAAPGYDLYYLNVMAGPERAWRFTDDPAARLDPRHVGGPGARPAAAADVAEEGRMRLTVAQALVRFLAAQHTERDGVQRRLIAGCFGIFGHGNVAGVGQALLEAELAGEPELPYHLARNEQGMVHAAVGYARMHDRLSTLACTSSIGPGATNMVTGAALATINRLPVLLLPGDIFSTRVASPVLQELEDPRSLDVSVNDAFRPVSRFFDRINRPEQLPSALLAAMRVLTDPVETGAVTLALPQDVQAEAHDWPEELFERRVWHVRRPPAEPGALAEAAALLRGARRPLIVAGGGAIYAGATEALRELAEATGIPVAETQAGKGSLPYDHPQAVGAIGATGTTAANALAREADVVLGVGTRWSDFTTASRSIFAEPGVRFVNLNVAPVDAHKQSALALVADARAGLEALHEALEGFSADGEHTRRATRARARVGRHGRGRLHGRPRPAPLPVRGARRRQPRQRPARRRRLRRGQHARRPAQALAHARPEGLPRRVRLLVHGLRDRRRAGREDGRPGARGVRDGRRRLLPDDGPGARDRRLRSTSSSRSCWSRTTASRRSARCRSRSARSASAPATASAIPGRARSTATSCRSTWPPTPPASAPTYAPCRTIEDFEAALREAAASERTTVVQSSRPTRSPRRPARRRGGMSRSRRSPGSRAPAPRAPTYDESKRTQKPYLSPSERVETPR